MLDGLVLPALRRSSLETATEQYAQSLTGASLAASYLASRGIGEQAALSFRLGSVDNPAPDHERFKGWLSIPYLAANGVVAIKFRRIDDSEGPKYDQPSQKARLYNSRVLAQGGEVVVICEGELDVVVCESVLGIPAVGTPGTTWLEHWPRTLGDYDRVIVVADHDVREDGSSPGVKQAKKVQASIPGADLVTPPAGMDLGEWVQEHGAGAVLKGLGL